MKNKLVTSREGYNHHHKQFVENKIHMIYIFITDLPFGLIRSCLYKRISYHFSNAYITSGAIF